MSNEERLIACFQAVFPALAVADIRDADMRRLASWDSAALLKLLADVERAFGTKFALDDINTFTSFASILDVLCTTAQVRACRGD
jgi:acyl carrier protein